MRTVNTSLGVIIIIIIIIIITHHRVENTQWFTRHQVTGSSILTGPGRITAVVKVAVCCREAQNEAPKAPRTRGGREWRMGIPSPFY